MRRIIPKKSACSHHNSMNLILQVNELCSVTLNNVVKTRVLSGFYKLLIKIFQRDSCRGGSILNTQFSEDLL